MSYQPEIKTNVAIGFLEDMASKQQDKWKRDALLFAIGDMRFLEYLYQVINPNDMEQYVSMYNSTEEKTNG